MDRDDRDSHNEFVHLRAPEFVNRTCLVQGSEPLKLLKIALHGKSLVVKKVIRELTLHVVKVGIGKKVRAFNPSAECL